MVYITVTEHIDGEPITEYYGGLYSMDTIGGGVAPFNEPATAPLVWVGGRIVRYQYLTKRRRIWVDYLLSQTARFHQNRGWSMKTTPGGIVTKSPGQDGKSGVSTPSVPPKTPGGTKPSRPTGSGSTSKPFWANGKPKCKKGFRYDYKRKLCVKIK